MTRRIVMMALVACLIAATLVQVSVAVASPVTLTSSDPAEMMRQAVGDWVVNHEMPVYHWRADSVTVDLLGRSIVGNEASATFDVKIVHRLDYKTPDESPALEGRTAYLSEATGLTESERAIATEEVNAWRKILDGYIKTPGEAWERLKVTAQVSGSGRVIPGTVKIYRDDGLDNFVLATEALGRLRSPDQVRHEAYNAIADTVKSSRAKRANLTLGTQTTLATYDRTAAASYANTWVKNTTLFCSTTTAQDHNNYNPNYQWYSCNDCANFASQVMKAGGIPTDSTWAPGTDTWVNVVKLRDYMTSHYHWGSATFSSLVQGDMITWISSKIEHVAICVYNDGTMMKYNGHSYDRLQYAYYGGDGATYWITVN